MKVVETATSSIKPDKGIGGWDIWGPADEELEARKSGL